RILLWHQLPKSGETNPDLRPEHDAAEPSRMLLVQDAKEFLEPRLVETLRRNPHLCLGMVAVQVLGLLRQQGYELLRRGVPRVAARNEHGIDSRQFREYRSPLLDGKLDRVWIRVVLVHRRVPYPNIQTVGVRNA